MTEQSQVKHELSFCARVLLGNIRRIFLLKNLGYWNAYFQFDPHLPSYIHHTDMQNYLQHYANHFNIMPLIHFSTVVTSITSNCMEYTPPPIGDIQFPVNRDDPPNTSFTFHEWKVTTQNVLTKVTNTEAYDAVMVCNG